MRNLILSIATSALLCTGCAQRCCDTSLYTPSGRQKPIVAVLPVLDNTNSNNLHWDLSRELTDEIRKRVFTSRSVYLLRDGQNMTIARLLSTPDPKSIPSKSAANLGAAEFAVVTEIIHQEEPAIISDSLEYKSEVGTPYSLALRLRVIDMRRETPKVILQEVLDETYAVTRAYTNCDYVKMGWGTDAFNYTPMGMAHNRLVRELVSRIETYINSAQ